MANGNDSNTGRVNGRSQEETEESASSNLETREQQLERLQGISEAERDRELSTLDAPNPGAFADPVVIPDSELSEIQEDLGTNQVDLLTQDTRRLRAKEQGLFETVGKETGKLIPEIPLTAAEYIGHIADIGSWNQAYHGAEATIKRLMGASKESIQRSIEDGEEFMGNEMGNMLTRAARGQREAIEESEFLGIDWETFREDPTDVWDLSDPAFYAQMGSDVMRSIFAFGGIASLGGAATRGIVGAASRALGAGSTAQKVMTGVGQAMTATELAQAEGMVTAIQSGKTAYRDALQAHLDQGKSRPEAERLAEKARNNAMATTAGINIMAIPALNFTSLLPAFRSSSALKSLSSAGLNRNAGETVKDWVTRATNSGLPSQSFRNISRYARESGFESVEELANELAVVEGEYRGQQLAGVGDPSTLGERISEEVMTSEGGLAAFMGAVGGAGQQALIRNVPLHQRVNDEGDSEIVSRATLEAERDMKKFEAMQETVKVFAQEFAQHQKDLKNAAESGSEQRVRSAQEALIENSVVKSFANGTNEQVRRTIEEIKSMSDEKAEESGFETDESSPYHYEKLADEYIDHIDSLRQVWDKYQNDFNYTQEEHAVNMPAQLFNIEARIRSMGEKEGRVEESLQGIQSDIDGLREAAKGQERNLGRMGSEVVKAKMNAVREVVKHLEEQDSVPSDFDSIEDLKSQVDYDQIRSNYLEDVTKRLHEASPEGQSPGITDIESFSESMRDSLDRDLVQAMDLVQIPGSDFNLQEILNPENIEAEDNTYRPPTAKDATNLVEMEVQRQSLRQKQRLYRDQLDHLHSPQGREAYMERVKNQQARETEEWINERRNEIENLQTIEQVEQYREELNPNSRQVLGDFLDAREQELDTEEKRGRTGTESDTEPTQSRQSESTESSAPAPGENVPTSPEDLDFDPEESDQQRTEQQAQDEPTGPSEPTTTTGTEPEVDTSPTPSQASTPGEEAQPTTTSASEPTESQTEPQQRGVLGDIITSSKEKEATLPSIIRKRVNNVISDLPPPDNNDEDAMSVDQWEDRANSILDNIQSEMEALAGDPRYNINKEQVRSIIEEKRQGLRDEAEDKALHRTTSDSDQAGGEPQNIGESQEEAQEDFTENVEDVDQDLSPKIRNRWNTINYQSRPLERTEDGEIIEISNQRNADLDKLVETPVVRERMKLEYRVEDNISQGQRISNDLIENAKIEVFGITENGEVRIGAIPLPQNIDSRNTLDVQNNIEQQRRDTRELRAKILQAAAQDPEATLTGVITEKRAGHISRKYTEESLGTTNPEEDVRTLKDAFSDEAFGDEEVQIYVLKDGRAHVSKKAHREVLNDFSGNHSAVEGSVGVVLPTPNGESIALPLHIPRVENIPGLTEIVYDTLTDENLNVQQKREQIEKYLFVSTGGSDQVFRNADDSEKPRIMFTDSGVVIGHNNGGLYSNDSRFQRGSDNRVLNNLEGNEETVKSIIDNMHLNVNLDRVNKNEPMEAGPHDEQFLRQYGTDLTYDDFLRQNLSTDILEVRAKDFEDKTHYIYFEQPTIKHETKFEQNEEASPSQQGSSTREHRTPLNVPPEGARVEREAQPIIAEMENQELADSYSNTLDEMNDAANENNPALYNSLRDRVQMLRNEAESRESMNADSFPPLPDQAEFPSPEEGGEVRTRTVTLERTTDEADNFVFATTKKGDTEGFRSIEPHERIRIEDTTTVQTSNGEATYHKLPDDASDRLKTQAREIPGREGLWISGAAFKSLEEIESQLEEGSDPYAEEDLEQFREDTQDLRTEVEEELELSRSGDSESQDSVDPVVEEGDVAFSAFIDTGDANDSIIEGIAQRVAAGENLTDAERAIRQEHSDRIEDALTDLVDTGELQAFDPNNVDLSNMQDPQARSWWRDASMEEIATHFEEIYNEDLHNPDSIDDTLLSHLRDDIFGEESWTYPTMKGDVLRTRLQDRAREIPQSTPSEDQGEINEDLVDELTDAIDGESGQTDLSPGFSYTQPVEVDSGVRLSQDNFEEIVGELQSEGELRITCRS